MQAAIEAPKKSSPARLIELDILRGFLLFWMTLTHLPTKASLISNQTFGFVSGAEGFIFLAGFMVGQLEHRIEQTRGSRGTFIDLLRRTLRVYLYHAALLIIAFTVFAQIGVRYGRLPIQNLLSFFFAHPKHATVAAALLEYRPSLLDILPMYVIFLLLTILARAVARRWGWTPIICASFALWGGAQFGLRSWLYHHVDVLRLGVPENSTGAFDMYAWQLLWMVGLVLGSKYAAALSAGEGTAALPARRTALPRWLILASISVAAVFLVLRYSPVDQWLKPDVYGLLIDKWHLGPARVINFAALTVFLVRYGQKIAALAIFRPFALLGRASIEVFSVHVLCCLSGDSLSKEADPNLPGWQQFSLLLVTVAALFGTGYLHSVWARRRKMRQALSVRPG